MLAVADSALYTQALIRKQGYDRGSGAGSLCCSAQREYAMKQFEDELLEF